MSLPKQLINLLGLLAVAAVIVLGAVAVALPLYTQSQSTDGETLRVQQTNNGYAIQVQTLQAAKKNLPQTEQEVAQLRAQISAPDHLDDAFEIAIKAAQAADSTITSMTTGDIEAFVPRTAVGEDGKAAAPTPAPTTDTAAADPTASAAPTADGTSSSSTTDAATSTPTGAPTADQRTQAPLTITVSVPSPDAAAKFLDGLRKGPRLIAIVHSTLTGSAASADTAATYTLAVDALAFVRTGD
ncbi:hypothetical protein [Microbacterium sp.]|uniref:hypothetical protein n=1 Tax=Microbacterium sp. TaxID=51671 RepID=UPI003A952254